MKQRLSIIFIFLLASLASFCQKVKIIPKIGLAVSDLTNQKLAVTDDYVDKEDSKPLIGIIAGIGLEYSFCNHLEFISGLSYIQQGCSFKDVIDENGNNQKNKLHYDYLGLPIKIRYKITDGLGFSSGLVVSCLVRAKHNGENVKSICKKFDCSLPISISYEFRNNMVVEASYNIGLRNVYEEGSTKNRSLICILGYKF